MQASRSHDVCHVVVEVKKGYAEEKPVAAVAPKATALAPLRLVPVMTTAVPPPVGPALGLTAVTVGAAT